MTLIYARIADRVVADEYQAISEKIDALYGQQLELPADYETTGMAKLRREAHARMLGNGLCTRPVQARLPDGIRLRNLQPTSRTHVQAHPPTANATTPKSTARTNAPPSSTNSSSAPAPGPRPPNGADHMPQISLDLADAAELAEMLTFLADWLTGSQKQALAGSLTAFVGHPAYNTESPLRRPAPVRLPPRRQ